MTRRIRSCVRPAGFTLIELVVTMVVIAILAAIAIPAYTSQMRKSRRTEAKTALLDLAAREERFSSTNSAYTATAANLGYSGGFPQIVGSGYYLINVTINAAGSTFSATATPQGVQAKDTACGTYTLDNTGTESVSGPSAATACW